jgi:hypothetical protein
MELIRRNIKLYAYISNMHTYYALGELGSTGYILDTSDSYDDFYYLGSCIGCYEDRLVKGKKINIDIPLLKRKGIFITTDNKIFIKSKRILIDLKRRTISVLTIDETEDLLIFRSVTPSTRKQLILSNS